MQRNDPKFRRLMRNAVILLGAFLLGVIPVLYRNLQLKQELARNRAALALSETRDVASRAFLEASRNNYGLAAEHTTQLYQRLSELAQNGDESTRSLAQDALNRRDTVMGMLATADGAAKNELQDLTSRLLTAGPSDIQTRSRTR